MPKRKFTLIEVFVIITILVVLVAILMPMNTGGGFPLSTTVCINNLKQIGLASVMYAGDNDERFQPAAHWSSVLKKYAKNDAIFACPVVRKENKDGFGYAFNASLSMKEVSEKLAATTPLVYDSTSVAAESSDPLTSLPNPGRHNGSNIIAYADSHAKGIKAPIGLAR